MSSMVQPTYKIMLPRWHRSKTKRWWTTEEMSRCWWWIDCYRLASCKISPHWVSDHPGWNLVYVKSTCCWCSPCTDLLGALSGLAFSRYKQLHGNPVLQETPHSHHKWNRRRVWNLGQTSHPTPIVHSDTVNLEFHRNLQPGYVLAKLTIKLRVIQPFVTIVKRFKNS